MRTLHSRGPGTTELATLIDPDTQKVGDSLPTSAVEHRAELLVARRTNAAKDLLPVAVPRDIDFDAVGGVVAAVAGGPHSELAARIASTLSARLEVPGRLVCAYQEGGGGRDVAAATVAQLADTVPGVDYRIVEGARVPELLEREGAGSLLVLGAPGGAFLQRQFFGPGARILARADVGAVVVAAAPPRVFQRMTEPEWVAIHLPASEALRLHGLDPLPVVDDGVLVGVAHRVDLERAGSEPVGSCMSEPVSVDATSDLADVDEVLATVGGGSLPVLHQDRLVGVFSGGS